MPAAGRSASRGDVREPSTSTDAVARLVSEFGGLDVLVNNAGVVRYGYLPKFENEDWDYVFDINIKAMYRTARVAIPEMRKRGGGAIVNLASVQAYWSHQGAVAYSASKGSVVAFTRALALDHAREGIRVLRDRTGIGADADAARRGAARQSRRPRRRARRSSPRAIRSAA